MITETGNKTNIKQLQIEAIISDNIFPQIDWNLETLDYCALETNMDNDFYQEQYFKEPTITNQQFTSLQPSSTKCRERAFSSLPEPKIFTLGKSKTPHCNKVNAWNIGLSGVNSDNVWNFSLSEGNRVNVWNFGLSEGNRDTILRVIGIMHRI